MIQNPRVKGIVNKFATSFSLTKNSEEVNFQLFGNYLIFKKVFFDSTGVYPYNNILNANLLHNIDLDTDTEKTMGADGCFLIYKENFAHLNLDDDDIDAFLTKIDSGTLDIVIIQSKSNGFVTTNLSIMSDCLKMNFDKQSTWNKLVSIRSQCDDILQKCPDVKIRFSIFYVFGSNLQADFFQNEDIIMRIDSLKKEMANYFWIPTKDIDNNVKIEFFDENKIFEEYTQQSESGKIISEIIKVDEITKEKQCGNYGNIKFAIFKISELKKILINTYGKPNELYGYNVRDLIEKSDINMNISDSIRENGELFLLLNNGITMLVDNAEKRGENGIYLKNIKIVNGCQTCHSIINVCGNNETYDSICVAVRIIQTDKKDIASKITFASNNQNTVSKSNKLAIEPKIFELEQIYEDFFLSYGGKLEKIKLERRQGQFNNIEENFIDMLSQAKSYIALWDKKPHSVIMYSTSILEEYEKHETDTDFINRSLFCGILYNYITKHVTSEYYGGRYHIFVCVVFDILKDKFNILDNMFDCDFTKYTGLLEKLKDLLPGTIDKKITDVYAAIDSIPAILPKTNGKNIINYRAYYKPNIIKELWDAYIKIKDDKND